MQFSSVTLKKNTHQKENVENCGSQTILKVEMSCNINEI